MNYRKLEDFRFMLFSYGLLLLGLLFIAESGLTFADMYSKMKFIAEHGYVFSQNSVMLYSTIATMKLVAGMLFLYISLEELRSIKLEKKLLTKRHQKK